jgi:hypothetical protein|tara:strand:+ start:793 stop:1017 length:225 start_codon:yes stop_codon:yes gene_type:complete
MDTCDSADWSTADAVNVLEVEQIGWLVSEDETQIKVADTRADGEYYGVTAIPRGCVVEISEDLERKHNECRNER